jgi:branched-chain amino acid transport system substrate-binding protein
MITAGAASDSTYQKGYTLVFQTYTPASRYLTGAVDLLASLDPSLTKLAIVHESDRFSTDVSTALNDYALSLGYEVVLFEGYDSATADFAPIINRIQDSAPDALLGGGHFQDGTTFARQLYEEGLPLQSIALLVAPPEPGFAELGEAALGVIGPSQWEPLGIIDESVAEAIDLPFYGPSSQDFIDAYQEAFDEEPSYHAAGGYVAGVLLQKAIEDADSLDSQAVKEALDNLDIMTFFGHMQFDTTPESHGLQIGHSMMYIQWQGTADSLEKQIIWPPEAATAETLFPLGGS